MAATATINYKDITADGEFYVDAVVSGDTSYPTGGYALPASLFTLNTFKNATGSQAPPEVPFTLVGDNAAAHSWTSVVNFATGKLQLYDVSATTSTSATWSELASTTNVSAYRAHVVVRGH